LVFNITLGEHGAEEYRHKDPAGEEGIQQQDQMGFKPSPQKDKGQEEGNTLHGTGQNPKLIGDVFSDSICGKDLHSLVGQAVQDIKDAYKKVGYSYKEEEMFTLNRAGIPSKNEDGTGYNDTEKFSKQVEEEVIVQRDTVEP
jgi:hypothetical protein